MSGLVEEVKGFGRFKGSFLEESGALRFGIERNLKIGVNTDTLRRPDYELQVELRGIEDKCAQSEAGFQGFLGRMGS